METRQVETFLSRKSAEMSALLEKRKVAKSRLMAEKPSSGKRFVVAAIWTLSSGYGAVIFSQLDTRWEEIRDDDLKTTWYDLYDWLTLFILGGYHLDNTFY